MTRLPRPGTLVGLGLGLLLSLSAFGQGNEYYLRVKASIEDASINTTSDESQMQVSRAFGDKGYRAVAEGLRAQIDGVVNEKLTLEMLRSDDVLGRLGLQVPGAHYVVLGVSRMHFEAQNRFGGFIYKANLSLKVIDMATQTVHFFDTTEGVGNAPSRRQASIDADRSAGQKMSAKLAAVLPESARGNWYRIRILYTDYRKEGLPLYRAIRAWEEIQETQRQERGDTAMMISVRSELSLTDFQDEFEMFIYDNFEDAELNFTQNVFNVRASESALADVTKHCEESDEAKDPGPPTEVEAAGYGALIDGDVDQAKKEALFQAFRSAVEQGVNVYIDSSTIVENFETIEDRIYTEAKGFVEDWTMVAEGQQDASTYFVRIRARVKYGVLRETLASLNVLQEKLGRIKTAVVYEWMPYDANPHAPAGPLHTARVLRHTDQPAIDAANEATRFLLKKRFAVYDQARMRGFYQRLQGVEQVHMSEVAVVDMLTQENLPCDLIVFVTAFSEGMLGQGERAVLHGKVQVKAYIASLQKVIDVKTRRGQAIVAAVDSDPVRQLSKLAQEETCQLMRGLWPELRGYLEEESTYEVYLRNFNASETSRAIDSIRGMEGVVKGVVRNRVADRFTSLTVYTFGKISPDRFLGEVPTMLADRMPREPKHRIDRRILSFSYETYIDD